MLQRHWVFLSPERSVTQVLPWPICEALDNLETPENKKAIGLWSPLKFLFLMGSIPTGHLKTK